MIVAGIITSVLGGAILLFSMVHDFNLAVQKGAMLQPIFFGAVGTVVLICGLIVLLFSVFKQRPYRG